MNVFAKICVKRWKANKTIVHRQISQFTEKCHNFRLGVKFAIELLGDLLCLKEAFQQRINLLGNTRTKGVALAAKFNKGLFVHYSSRSNLIWLDFTRAVKLPSNLPI